MVLGTLDLIVIVAYLAVILYIAYRSSKISSEEAYLIADRDVGMLGTMASINASKTGAILLIFTALLYQYGASAVWYFIGIGFGYAVFLPFAMKLHKRHAAKHYTQADYFYHEYGSTTGKCASILNIYCMLALLMLNLIASSKVIGFFTGMSFELSMLVVIVFVLAYLLAGGFKAVVVTDMIQYGAIMAIFVVFAFVLTQGVTIPAADWNLVAAGAQNVIGFFLLGLLFPFASPELWQRVYACKDVQTLKKSIWWSILTYLFMAGLLTIVGLSIKAQMPNIDPDIALIHGFSQLLPSGLVGLAVVIFFAAFMSTIDTAAYTAASALVQDFFKGLSKKKTVRAVRWTIAGFVALMSVFAVLLQDLLLGAYIFIGYVMILAIVTIATWIKPSIKKTTLNTALIFGTIVLTVEVVRRGMAGSLSPLIALFAIQLGLVSLILGAIISKFKS